MLSGGAGVTHVLKGGSSIFSVKWRITFENFYSGKTDTVSGNAGSEEKHPCLVLSCLNEQGIF